MANRDEAVLKFLKRVPVNFSWPIGKTWEGFKSPHFMKCLVCKGNQQSPDYRAFEALAHQLVYAAEASAKAKTRTYLPRSLQELGISDIGPRFHEIIVGLIRAGEGEERAKRFEDDLKSGSVIGGGSSYSLMLALAKLAGLPRNWWDCAACGGSGIDAAVAEAHARWRPYEPPNGPGYQLWTNASDGGPISGVFETLEELSTWASEAALPIYLRPSSAEEWFAYLSRQEAG